VKPDGHLRKLRAGDLEQLAATMRPEDAAEVRATGLEPLQALEQSVAASAITFAVELGGELAAVGGVVAVTNGLGPAVYHRPWLLTAPAVVRHRSAFWTLSKRVVLTLRSSFPLLVNHVDERYAAAVRWARRLGAEVRPAVPFGASGELFHPIVWRSPWAQG